LRVPARQEYDAAGPFKENAMRTIDDVIDAGRAAGAEADKERAERAAELRRRIEAGETTGDPIRDFLVWLWPLDHEEALPHYRALAERLKGRTGQYVLMIERRDASGGGMRTLGPSVKETFTLGILKDDRLALKRDDGKLARGTLAFPTGRHASCGDGYRKEAAARDGDMRPMFYDTLFWHAVEKPVEIRSSGEGGCFGPAPTYEDFSLGAERDKPMTVLELHVGNEEIDAWCRRGATHFPKDAPNETRCALIAGLARPLGGNGSRIAAVSQSRDARRKKLLKELAARGEELRAAGEELNGADDPRDPAGLVQRYRGAKKAIRALLDEAESLGMEDPLVKRLRAAHPHRPAK
jgi:hypothetical protein